MRENGRPRDGRDTPPKTNPILQSRPSQFRQNPHRHSRAGGNPEPRDKTVRGIIAHICAICVICGSDDTVPFAKRRGRGSEATAGDAPGGKATKKSPLPHTPTSFPANPTQSFPRRREPRTRGQNGAGHHSPSAKICAISGSDDTVPFAKRRGRGSEATAGDAPRGRALKASPSLAPPVIPATPSHLSREPPRLSRAGGNPEKNKARRLIPLSLDGCFAQLDIGAVTRPNRRLVPVCHTPLDSRLRGNDVSCAKHPRRERAGVRVNHSHIHPISPYYPIDNSTPSKLKFVQSNRCVLPSTLYTLWSQIDGSGQLSSRETTRGIRTNTLKASTDIFKIIETIDDRTGGNNRPVLIVPGSTRKQCPLPPPPPARLSRKGTRLSRGGGNPWVDGSSYLDRAGSDRCIKGWSRRTMQSPQCKPIDSTRIGTGQSRFRGRVRCLNHLIAWQRRRREPGVQLGDCHHRLYPR